LVRHYFYETELPLITEESMEFSSLMRYLQLTGHGVKLAGSGSGHVSGSGSSDDSMGEEDAWICEGLNWFR
jgi:hypothetical protein